MALMVKSRRARSSASDTPYCTCGLREPRFVLLATKGRDLDVPAREDQTNRPELLTYAMHGIGLHVACQPAHGGRYRVGREVQVGARPLQEPVAHGATYQIELMAGRCEGRRETRQHRIKAIVCLLRHAHILLLELASNSLWASPTVE